MKSLQRSMKQAQKSIDNSTQSLESAWNDLGSAVITSSEIDISTLDSASRSLAERINSDKAELAEIETTVQHISQHRHRLDEIHRRADRIPKEINELEESNRPIFRVVGEHTLSLYGARETADPRLRDLLAEPRAISRELADIRRRLDQLANTPAKGPVTHIRHKLNAARLLPKQAMRQRALSAAHEILGKQLLTGTVLQEMNDPDVESVASGYFKNQRDIEALQDESGQLDSERDKLGAELGKLGAAKNTSQRLDYLELQRRSLQKDITAQQVKLGKRYFQHCSKNSSPADVDDLINRINDLTSAVQAEKHRVERLEAAIQREKLVGRQREHQRKLRLIEAHIADKQQEAERLRQEIQSVALEIQQLEALSES